MPLSQALERYINDISPENVRQTLARLLRGYSTPAKTAVIESNYIDIDYSASYYAQRGRSFVPAERETKRIHFFSQRFTKSSLIEATQNFRKLLNKSYLGYTVIRPGIPRTLSRTFLSYPEAIEGFPARFPTRAIIQVDLAGIPLQIESCPYLSQDERVMACATAALWMSSFPLASKITGVSQHLTTEITAMALSLNRPYGPAIGRRGLDIREMEHAFLTMGFDPQVWTNPLAAELLDVCHIYTDSGIPPVLVIEIAGELHAVTVVGFTLDPNLGLVSKTVPKIMSASRFVPHLILHDDQGGMYLLADIRKAGNIKYKTELIIRYTTGTSSAHCLALIVPFPARVMLDGSAVRVQATEWIRYFKTKKWLRDIPIICRVFLVKSNSFKEELLKLQDDGSTTDTTKYPKGLVNAYRGLAMPRYIWVAEAAYVDSWNGSDPNAPPTIIDMVFDSTSTETEKLEYLSIHLPGLVVNRQITGKRISVESFKIDNDNPHPPFPNVLRP